MITDIIGIHPKNNDDFPSTPKNSDFESDYVPFITLKNEHQKNVVENYIYQEIANFMNKILAPGIEWEVLPYSKLITDKDFKKVKIKYFYENLLTDWKRKENNELTIKIKCGITFDTKCVPMEGYVSQSDSTGDAENTKTLTLDAENKIPYRKFGTIDINGYPVFYYIYFTIQEILDVIKEL